MQLRDYQTDLVAECDAIWYAEPSANVLAVAPTGSGKTVFFAYVLSREPGASVAIAHRSELVSQMSLALARNGVRHRVIGPQALQRACSTLHLSEVGHTYVHPQARCAVAGVDTLVRRDAKNDPWFAQVRLVVQDEAHHVLADNKWGKASKMFPNARTLGVTATPVRADGQGLGDHADGIMHEMVVGPTMRDLIRRGYLTEYRVFAPSVSDLHLEDVPLSASGDFSPPKLRAAVHKSHIVGDVVAHYLRVAPGKLGVTFAVDVESATELAAAYRAAGVPSEVVSADTPDLLRAQILRRFRNREILQLCNVDLFGEGFDLPAIEVVSMARPTQSYSLYAQQFGRALRPLPGKTHALIIDHVGNVQRHGLPDAPRVWTLDRRERRAAGTPNDVIPVRVCIGCTSVYERYLTQCPHCGWRHEPSGRSTPEQVDGILSELDPEVLARMRGEVAALDGAYAPFPGWSAAINGSKRREHWERQEAQRALRAAMATWGGWKTHEGRAQSEAEALFYFRYGVSLVEAWALPRADAEALRSRIERDLLTSNVRSTQ